MFYPMEPASQLLVSSDDEEPEQDHVDIDLVTPPRPKRLPGKRPHRVKRFLNLEAEDIDSDVPPSSEEVEKDSVETRNVVNLVEDVTDLRYPDLEEYFRQKQFRHVSNYTKISMCRTFANYLNQVERSKGELKAKVKKARF